MWTVVYIAPHKREAERIKNYLHKEGFLVRLRPVGMSQENDCGPVEILVPESEVEEVMENISKR